MNDDGTQKFSSSAPMGKTRARITLDFEKGLGDFFTNYTCWYTDDGKSVDECVNSKPISINSQDGSHSSNYNRFWVSHTIFPSIWIDFELWNAATVSSQPDVAIDGHIQLTFGSKTELCYSGDSYPAMEAYQRKIVNGAERTIMLVNEPAGSPYGLMPSLGERNKCYRVDA